MSGGVRILGFVNHIPAGDGVEDAIARALEWGVDYIVAQGTGSDWGPYWLGSGEALAVDVGNNVRPYLRAAVEHGIPFLFSVGLAGAEVHLERSLKAIDALCAEEGWQLRVGVVNTEIAPERLAALTDDGREIRRAQDVDELAETLDARGRAPPDAGRGADRAGAARGAAARGRHRRDHHRARARHRALHGARHAARPRPRRGGPHRQADGVRRVRARAR